MGLLERLFKKTPKRNKEEGTALIRYKKSFFHAIEGFVYCLRFEHNMSIIVKYSKFYLDKKQNNKYSDTSSF